MSKSKRIKKLEIFLVLVALIVGVSAYYNLTIRPLVINLAEAEIKNLTINAINKGALKLRVYSDFYNDFYEYEKNQDGDVTLIKANTSNINLMSIYAQNELQKSINALSNDKIAIPAGAFTGSAWLADKGEPIEINVMPVGSVEAKINSYYYNEGINQTLHRLVLKVTTTVKVIVPVKAENITVVNEILLAEDIIAGRVPDSYVTGISDDNIYDLLP
ncbi:MAG: sporulation protein YunB [Clostridia bacterium]|nr:sporulation protein YunB [Clostridia bacterium]